MNGSIDQQPYAEKITELASEIDNIIDLSTQESPNEILLSRIVFKAISSINETFLSVSTRIDITTHTQQKVANALWGFNDGKLKPDVFEFLKTVGESVTDRAKFDQILSKTIPESKI